MPSRLLPVWLFLGAMLLPAMPLVAQGTAWCNNDVTIQNVEGERFLHVSSDIVVTINKVEYWNGSQWISVSFGASSVPAKELDIDLGDEYLQETTLRVLLNYQGGDEPEADLTEGAGVPN